MVLFIPIQSPSLTPVYYRSSRMPMEFRTVMCNPPLSHRERLSTNRLWVDDRLPAGATPGSDGGELMANGCPKPITVRRHIVLAIKPGGGEHQCFFTNATTSLSVQAFDTLFCYVYLNPDHPPTEIMLQWRIGDDFEHRAYWGEDNITIWGTNGTASRRYMGPLPAADSGGAVPVPASAVGAVGTTLNGMAYTLFDGQATFDQTGISSEKSSLPKRSDDAIHRPHEAWRARRADL